MIRHAFETLPSSSARLSNDSFLRVLCGRAVIGISSGEWVTSQAPNLHRGPGGRSSAFQWLQNARLSDNAVTTSLLLRAISAFRLHVAKSPLRTTSSTS